MLLVYFGLILSALASTKRPVIGILTVDLSVVPAIGFAASYVKFVEQGGGRVVPIIHKWSKNKIIDTLDRIDGALFTGGVATETYTTAVSIIMDYAKEHSFFPIWGTCLGFEVILMYEGVALFDTNANGYTTSVDLNVKMVQISKMFPRENPLVNYVLHLLGSDITANTHHYGVNRTALAVATSDYRVLGTSLDMSGTEYIAIVENIRYPIYATQFHPEKVMFEWNEKYNDYLPKTIEAVVANSYFAQFFIDETRKGPGHLTDSDQEWVDKHVIYNYEPVYQGYDNERDTIFEQLYIFGSNPSEL